MLLTPPRLLKVTGRLALGPPSPSSAAASSPGPRMMSPMPITVERQRLDLEPRGEVVAGDAVVVEAHLETAVGRREGTQPPGNDRRLAAVAQGSLQADPCRSSSFCKMWVSEPVTLPLALQLGHHDRIGERPCRETAVEARSHARDPLDVNGGISRIAVRIAEIADDMQRVVAGHRCATRRGRSWLRSPRAGSAVLRKVQRPAPTRPASNVARPVGQCLWRRDRDAGLHRAVGLVRGSRTIRLAPFGRSLPIFGPADGQQCRSRSRP